MQPHKQTMFHFCFTSVMPRRQTKPDSTLHNYVVPIIPQHYQNKNCILTAFFKAKQCTSLLIKRSKRTYPFSYLGTKWRLRTHHGSPVYMVSVKERRKLVRTVVLSVAPKPFHPPMKKLPPNNADLREWELKSEINNKLNKGNTESSTCAG